MRKNMIVVIALVLIASLGLPVFAAETLTIWSHTNIPANAYTEKLVKQYNEENPDVNVLYEPSADNLTYMDKLITALAAGAGPDVFSITHGNMVALIELGVLDELDLSQLQILGYDSMDDYKNQFLPGTIDKLMYQDKLYGVYREMNIYGILLNRQAYAEAGLDAEVDYPRTWDDVLSLAPQITKFDGRRLERMFMFVAKHTPIWSIIPMEPVIKQFGGSILSEDGTHATLNQPESKKAFEMWRELVRIQNNAPVNFPDAPYPGMTKGEVGQYFAATWTLQYLRNMVDGDENYIKDNFVLKPLPKVEGSEERHAPIEAWVWVVNASSKSKEEAWKMHHWMTTEERAKGWYEEVGYLIPHNILNDVAETDPFLGQFLELAEDADFVFAHPQFNEIASILHSMWQEILVTDNDLQRILDNAAMEIDIAIGYR